MVFSSLAFFPFRGFFALPLYHARYIFGTKSALIFSTLFVVGSQIAAKRTTSSPACHLAAEPFPSRSDCLSAKRPRQARHDPVIFRVQFAPVRTDLHGFQPFSTVRHWLREGGSIVSPLERGKAFSGTVYRSVGRFVLALLGASQPTPDEQVPHLRTATCLFHLASHEDDTLFLHRSCVKTTKKGPTVEP